MQLLPALFMLLIPNTTANHAITYTNTALFAQAYLTMSLVLTFKGL